MLVTSLEDLVGVDSVLARHPGYRCTRHKRRFDDPLLLTRRAMNSLRAAASRSNFNRVAHKVIVRHVDADVYTARTGRLRQIWSFTHLQQREVHWAIVDLIGKGGHIRTVPVPEWVKATIDIWVSAAEVSTGRLFRCVCRAGKTWGNMVSERVVWHVVKQYAKAVGLAQVAPHDLRRYAECGISGALAPNFAMRAAENWSRSNSYSGMFPSKRPNGTWGASSESAEL